MADAARRPVKVLTDGYMLSTPAGNLLGHTYRTTENDAIVTLFPINDRGYELWTQAQRDGWTVEYVFARFFSPVFFVDVVPEPAGSMKGGEA